MKTFTATLILFSTTFVFILVGCKKDSVQKKFIDGAPIALNEEVIPASAVQEFYAVHRDALHVVIPAIHNTINPNADFSNLTPQPATLDYSATTSNPVYGTASLTIKFLNGQGDPIFPITSTNTLKSVDWTLSCTSMHFTHGPNSYTLTLNLIGNPNSDIYLAGTTALSGSGYTMNFIYPAPGPRVDIGGFIGSYALVSGSGPTSPVSIQLNFGLDFSINGPISWENRTGTLHISSDIDGFVVTDGSRIILN